MRKFFVLFCILILAIVFIYISNNKLAAFYNNVGADLYEKGSYKKAIPYFKKSLAILPKNGLAHLNLANTYRESHLEDKAITEYERCIQLTPKNGSAYKSLTRIYMQQKKYTDALIQLKKGLDLNPADNEMKVLLEQASFEITSDYASKAIDEFLSGDKKHAYELLNNAINIKNDSAYTHYILGYFYYAEHKFNDAIKELEKVMQIKPQFNLANKLLGDIYFDSGNYAQAIEQYKSLLNITPDDYILHNNIAIALTRLEDYREALIYIKKASELAPLNPNIIYALANIYRDNNMPEDALSEYNKLSDYPNLHNDKARIYEAQGRMKEAALEYAKQIEYCKRKLSENPYDALTLNNLANAYIGIKEYAMAEIVINKAIKINHSDKHNYTILANIQKNLGQYSGASKTLASANQLPDSPGLKIIKTDASYIKNGLHPFAKKESFVDLDKIYLKNGRVFEGTIKSETAEKIVLEVKIGDSTGNIILYANTVEYILRAKRNK